jgi:hypothetical protein
VIVSAETVVHTPRGDRFVGNLARMGETVYGFTYTMGRIQLGRVGFERLEPEETCRVVLDNGKSLRCPLNTELVSRDGDNLRVFQANDQSVMPLYMKTTPAGYVQFRQVWDRRKEAPAPSDRKPWRSLARMIWEWRTGQRLQPGFVVRHIDGDRSNCHPDNLRMEGKPQRKPRKNKLRNHIAAQRMTLPNNHKVVGIAPWGDEPVCKVVPLDCTNVALNEVFVVTYGT